MNKQTKINKIIGFFEYLYGSKPGPNTIKMWYNMREESLNLTYRSFKAQYDAKKTMQEKGWLE